MQGRLRPDCMTTITKLGLGLVHTLLVIFLIDWLKNTSS